MNVKLLFLGFVPSCAMEVNAILPTSARVFSYAHRSVLRDSAQIPNRIPGRESRLSILQRLVHGLIVLPDADIRQSACDLLERKVRAAGKACSSVNRVLAHAHIHERFYSEVAQL